MGPIVYNAPSFTSPEGSTHMGAIKCPCKVMPFSIRYLTVLFPLPRRLKSMVWVKR